MMVNLPGRAFGGAILTFGLLLATGCGSGEKPSASVGGTVSYNGSPLTSGVVNLISKTGSAGMAKISDRGAFEVEGNLEIGNYTAYVSPPTIEPQPPGQKPAPAVKFDLPKKFQAPGTSNTTVTVKAGANRIAVELAD